MAVFQLIGSNGRTMVPIRTTGLRLGQVVSYGDMANPRHKAVVTSENGGHYGQRCIFIDTLNITEVSITSIESPGGWEFERDPDWSMAACFELEAKAQKLRELETENRRLKAEVAERENNTAQEKGTGKVPTWAKAVIVAELVQDECDPQTDYFATSTKETILLAFSAHTKDNFAEMRKAAATFEHTKHLGPGRDTYIVNVILQNDVGNRNGSAYWANTRSHWHGEFCPYDGIKFETRAEAETFIASQPAPHDISFDGTIGRFAWDINCDSVEHREKYSMGHGYYLKRGSRYSSGWEVRKIQISADGLAVMIGKGKVRPGLI